MSNGITEELKVGLALSGGGYRATLFSLGSLIRLNELGWLPKIDIITSVSGGSILSGVLAYRWNTLNWRIRSDGTKEAVDFEEKVVAPVKDFCSITIDVAAGLEGLLSPFSTIADKIAETYDDHLFHGATLQNLPAASAGETPRFVFYATSLQTGSSVRISRKYLADYKIGRIDAPDISLARVVGASSAFPPVLSPVELKMVPDSWVRTDGAYLYDNVEFRRRMLLTDGGVYDNMGLEAIWDRCSTVLVSDGGAPLEIQSNPTDDWTRQLKRVLDIVTDQSRALRKRKLIQDFIDKVRAGTYWGITTKIGDYSVLSPLAGDNAITGSLKHIRTRLNAFSTKEQGQLINWGYALADAAMRKHVAPMVNAGVLPIREAHLV